MSGLRDLADRLDRAAEQVAEVPGALARYEQAPFDDLAGAPGRIGDIGRDLRKQCTDAWHNRYDEAADAARRIDRLADGVRGVRESYSQAEDTVRDQHPQDWGL
jgi:hypothetical protein